MTARDWLEMVRDCAGELDGMHQELLALIDARDACLPWQTKGSPVYGSMGGSCSNPTQAEALGRISGLDDQIALLTAKVNESERTVGDCLMMLDAMRCELGERYADVLELYYIDCADTWTEVALEMGRHRDTVRMWRDEAIAWIDANSARYGIMR
jgi:hypothetical protein